MTHPSQEDAAGRAPQARPPGSGAVGATARISLTRESPVEWHGTVIALDRFSAKVHLETAKPGPRAGASVWLQIEPADGGAPLGVAGMVSGPTRQGVVSLLLSLSPREFHRLTGVADAPPPRIRRAAEPLLQLGRVKPPAAPKAPEPPKETSPPSVPEPPKPVEAAPPPAVPSVVEPPAAVTPPVESAPVEGPWGFVDLPEELEPPPAAETPPVESAPAQRPWGFVDLPEGPEPPEVEAVPREALEFLEAQEPPVEPAPAPEPPGEPLAPDVLESAEVREFLEAAEAPAESAAPDVIEPIEEMELLEAAEPPMEGAGPAVVEEPEAIVPAAAERPMETEALPEDFLEVEAEAVIEETPAPPLPEPTAAERAKALAERGDHAGAWKFYYEALQASPEDLSLWYALGVTLSQLNQRDETAEAFRYVVRRGDPDSEEVKHARQWLLRAGRLGEPKAPAVTPTPLRAPEPETRTVVRGRISWKIPEPSHEVLIVLQGLEKDSPRLHTRVPLGEEYEFEDLAPGAYHLIGGVESQWLWDVRFTLEAGQELTLDLTRENSTHPRARL